MKTTRLSTLSMAVAAGLMSTSAWSSNGNVMTVDSLADGSLPGTCTLRDALLAASSNTSQGGCPAGQPGQDQIQISVLGTLELTEGALEVTSDVIITGPGVDEFTIDAGGQSRIFEIFGDNFFGQVNDVRISDMSLTNVGPNLAGGGAVFLDSVGQAVIERLVIRDGLRGGIRAQYSGNLTVTDTTIENTARIAISANIGSGELLVDNVTLTGNGMGLDCACDLTLVNSTITGNADGVNAGGVETYQSNVYIADSVISGNSSGNVGGLYLNVNELDMHRVTISGNSGALAGGMLVRTLNAAHIEGVSIVDNQASGVGNRGVGGMKVNTRPLGNLRFANSTISGNYGPRAGGIDFDDNAAGMTRFDHLTVTLNVADDALNAVAGGLSFRVNQADLDIGNSIFANNSAVDGLGADIVAWTRAGAQDPIVPGASLPVVFSRIEDPQGCTTSGSVNLIDQAAELGPLADNGGPTLTHHPLPTSPVLNAGDPDFSPPPESDQRCPGFPRVRGGRIDIGAVEADFDQIFTDRFE
ncbi:MAG: right-handed parallel beta-helix repeat-containing protein [Wenzhouxiangella sp.]|nr:right-handed parallel beta-helix repeat-containing protein [Wenzhouxiangella sp.]